MPSNGFEKLIKNLHCCQAQDSSVWAEQFNCAELDAIAPILLCHMTCRMKKNSVTNITQLVEENFQSTQKIKQNKREPFGWSSVWQDRDLPSECRRRRSHNPQCWTPEVFSIHAQAKLTNICFSLLFTTQNSYEMSRAKANAECRVKCVACSFSTCVRWARSLLHYVVRLIYIIQTAIQWM